MCVAAVPPRSSCQRCQYLGQAYFPSKLRQKFIRFGDSDFA
jgi:hypothetical protein